MSKQQEALRFLDDLDSLNADTVAVTMPPDSTTTTTTTTSSTSTQQQPSSASSNTTQGPNQSTPQALGGSEADALAFLDEITQKSVSSSSSTTGGAPRSIGLAAGRSLSSTPRTASRISLRKGADGNVSLSRSASPAPGVSAPGTTTAVASGANPSSAAAPASGTNPTQASSGGWGWSSVWTSASAAVKQARTVVDEQVKNLPVSIPNVPIPNNEQAKKWSEGMLEYVKNAQLDKLGQDLKSVGISTFTEILNVVAPPIAEHEVIEIWLSHDMRGYDGVESLVYECMAKVLEQVEGGDLVVNKGRESRPKDNNNGPERELGGVEGYDAAMKLSKANIEELIKAKPERPPRESSATNPTTYSSVYLHIQPYITDGQLQFVLHLSSPSYGMVHTTVTQRVPHKWIVAFEKEDERRDKSYGWVEDTLVEVLRVGIGVIGQEYLAERMGWLKENEEERKMD